MPTDFVALQNDLLHILLTAECLQTVNVKQYRKMVIESEIDMRLVYMTARMSRVGAGILVEMPLLNVNKPNVEGPILEVDIPILVMENPTVNMNAKASTAGTMKSAEEIVQDVLDVLHHQRIDNLQLVAAANAVQPANEYRGVVAYRVHIATMAVSAQTRRPLPPTITVTAGEATMSCATAGAEIYFTLDGSYPGKVGQPTAMLYNAPVPVNSGDVIRAASYLSGLNPGISKRITA